MMTLSGGGGGGGGGGGVVGDVHGDVCDYRGGGIQTPGTDGGVARWVRFARGLLGGDVLAAGVAAEGVTGYGRDDEERASTSARIFSPARCAPRFRGRGRGHRRGPGRRCTGRGCYTYGARIFPSRVSRSSRGARTGR